MRDEAFESVRMACHPVSHVSAIGSAGSCQPVWIYVAQGQRVVRSLHQIFVHLAAPVIADLVDELLPKSRGAPRIRHHHDIALSSEYLAVPSVAHRVAPDALRAAMDCQEQ